KRTRLVGSQQELDLPAGPSTEVLAACVRESLCCGVCRRADLRSAIRANDQPEAATGDLALPLAGWARAVPLVRCRWRGGRTGLLAEFRPRRGEATLRPRHAAPARRLITHHRRGLRRTVFIRHGRR